MSMVSLLGSISIVIGIDDAESLKNSIGAKSILPGMAVFEALPRPQGLRIVGTRLVYKRSGVMELCGRRLRGMLPRNVIIRLLQSVVFFATRTLALIVLICFWPFRMRRRLRIESK
jgi:hypothetical protein